MPLPTPNKKEKTAEKGESLFVSRCMADSEVQKTFKTQEQRLAVCYSQYKKAKKKKEAKGEIEEPTWEECSSDKVTILDY